MDLIYEEDQFIIVSTLAGALMGVLFALEKIVPSLVQFNDDSLFQDNEDEAVLPP